mmetsp:Transcript_29984/g.63225  ORF Transcript_29984/g.63225 Transcript_29984/m.63225 type:complete len:292 (+) Transcript_29984:201-1076(+)
MANKPCLLRLRKELCNFSAPPFIRAIPLENNMQEWHYVLQGPPDSPYEGGLYHGKIRFPDDFPFKPPSIYMITPNGRFETDKRLCLSMSDFHPESWVPTWSVSTILNGVLSFMLESTPTTGAIETTVATKHRLRDESAAFNDKNEVFRKLFPDLVGGRTFTDPAEFMHAPQSEATPGAATAAATTTAPASAATSASAVANEVVGESAAASALDVDKVSLAEAEAVSGKNAAKNKKKRDKAAAKKKQLQALAGATQGPDDGGVGAGADDISGHGGGDGEGGDDSALATASQH